MSCIYIYKGRRYSEKDFKNFIKSKILDSQTKEDYSWNEFSKLSEKEQDRLLSESEQISFNRTSDQIKVAVRMNTGKSLVGIAANHNVAHAMMQNKNINLRFPFAINEEVYNNLSGMYDRVGKRISENIAELLAAFVDNGKDPQAEYSNINETTAGFGFFLLHAGVPLRTMQLMLSQPVMVKLSDYVFNRGMTVENAVEIIKKTEDFSYEKLTDKNLLSMIDKDAMSIKVLELFENLSITKENFPSVVSRLESLVGVLKAGDIGLGPDKYISERNVEKVSDYVNAFSRAPSKDPLLNSANLVMDSGYMSYLFKKGMDEAHREILDNLNYPSLTMGPIGRIKDIYNKYYNLTFKGDDIKILFEEFIRFLSTKSNVYKFEPIGLLASEVRDLQEKYPNNKFLSKLSFQKTKIKEEGFFEKNSSLTVKLPDAIISKIKKGDQTAVLFSSSKFKDKWLEIQALSKGDYVSILSEEKGGTEYIKFKSNPILLKKGTVLNKNQIAALSKSLSIPEDVLIEKAGFGKALVDDYYLFSHDYIGNGTLELINFDGVIGTSKEEIDRIKNSFLELMYKEPEMFKKLINYSFRKDGFRMSLNGFSSFTPIQFLIESKEGIEYLNGIEKDLIQMGGISDYHLHQFVDSFIKENFHLLSGIPRMTSDGKISSVKPELYKKDVGVDRDGNSYAKLYQLSENGRKYIETSKEGIWDGSRKLLSSYNANSNSGVKQTKNKAIELAQQITEASETASILEFNVLNELGVTKPYNEKDPKDVTMASIATKFIGYGVKETVPASYMQQIMDAGNKNAINSEEGYSEKDVVFISFMNTKGSKKEIIKFQDKSILEGFEAMDAGAKVITDNINSAVNDSQNKGQLRFIKNAVNQGYDYSETVVDGKVLGVWYKTDTNTTSIDVKIENSNNQKIEKLWSEYNDKIVTKYGSEITFDVFKETAQKALENMTIEEFTNNLKNC